ncbi:MAG TPA: DNA modification methylase [Humisphaera sp.]
MDVQLRPIDEIRPYTGNPMANDAAVDAVARSLTEFGWRQPVVVAKDGVVVVGHTRLKAAKKLGMTHVPVHVAADLTPAQARAYRIADNQTATLADWDDDLLAAELAGLQQTDVDLAVLGFDPAELARLAGTVDEGQADPDEVPEPPADPVTKPGDLWVLGDHRLLCGDATNAADVAKVLGGAVPFLMVCDPPYGVDYQPSWRNAAGISDTARTGVVANDDRVDWTAAYKLFPGRVAYVWHAGRFAGTVASNLEACGFEVRAQIIWKKSRFAISRGAYHWQHEPAWYAVREGGSAKWCGDRKQSTIWEIDSRDQDATTVHGTQKPVECMERPVRNHGGPGDDVFDPFCGSGTTVIACQRVGRRCYAMELSPAYCDVIVARWERFTGKKAVRQRADEGTPAAGAGVAGKAGGA